MRSRFRSIRAKLSIAFVLIILAIVSITIVLHVRSTEAIRASIYTEMLNNVAYYQQNLDGSIDSILELQIDFFQDRKLPFLSGKDSLLNDYERREAYLSVQERLLTITGVSELVESGILYFPKTGYAITESRIGTMTTAQKAELESFLSYGNSDMYFKDGHFFVARTGEVRTSFSSNPNQLFVISFSTDEIKRELKQLTQERGGGAFLFDRKNDVLLESDENGIGNEIFSSLKLDMDNPSTATQRIRVNGKSYLVLVQPTKRDGIIVQYVPENNVTGWIRQSWLLTGLFIAAMAVFAVLFIMYVHRTVHKPLDRLSKAFERVEGGVLTEHIYHDRGDEFGYIYQRFNSMEDRLDQLIDEVYVQKNLAQKAELKQLQAQINPHFLYNSFFILSRRISREDYEGAEDISNHLGNYFKYLARDMSDEIQLKEETEHARSYAAIQSARFSSRIKIEFGELPEEWKSFMVPRLILQPLLENSFKYGLEDRMEDGLLHVSFTPNENGLKITVEDNGQSDSDPEAMQSALETQEIDIVSGMINIHRRLKIYFHGESGLKISRSELGGIAVSMNLPGREETK